MLNYARKMISIHRISSSYLMCSIKENPYNAAYKMIKIHHFSSSYSLTKFNWKAIEAERKYWPKVLNDELRSNHAGETGAVYIYTGAKKACAIRNLGADTEKWIENHENTEKLHLDKY